MTHFQALQADRDEQGAFCQKVVTRELDSLPAGDVLVRVRYSSLNYKDALSATGNPGVTRNYPHTPGIDAAGELYVINYSAGRILRLTRGPAPPTNLRVIR